MTVSAQKASLRSRYLLIAAGPAILFSISSFLMNHAGQPFDIAPVRITEFDMYRISAARTSVLGTFMLFVGVGLGALCFFVYTLQMLDWRSWLRTILAFLLLAAAAVFIGWLSGNRPAQDYVGRQTYCIAAHYNEQQSEAARKAELDEALAAQRARTPAAAPAALEAAVRAQQPAGVAVQRLPGRPACEEAGIWSLGAWQFNLVALAFSGLMFGAICCLATPSWLAAVRAAPPPAGTAAETAAEDNPELRYWEQQSGWLNIYLYLSALLLGTAMVFINAYLRFPAYMLPSATDFDANVAASVSYYGFVFTLMLGAFYIPVATILANRVRRLKPAAPGTSKLPEAFQGPLQILKIVLGLFSTALAGVLPNILGMIS